MPFFKDLRRLSKASFSHGDNSSNGSDGYAGTVPASKSTSTLNSTNGAPSAYSKPPSLSHSRSNNTIGKIDENCPPGTAPPVPPRPSPLSQQNKRASVAGSISGSMTTAPKVPTSLYAPRILSILDNSWVNHKVLLIYGQAGQGQRPLDGTLTITHNQDSFPPTQWPVCETHFKALVHLTPGINDLRLDFASPKLVSTNSSMPHHTSRFRINFLPLTNAPPLQMVLLLGKDSPGTYDAPPEKIQKDGNDLSTAVRKFRMAGYLWSAYTSEQMYRNGFGRRTFRFEEEYQTGTLSSKDKEMGQMRNEAKIHVIRSDKTVSEIRDLDRAQQNPQGTKKGDLYGFAMDAVKSHFKCLPGQKQYVALMILDSHWDKKAKIITGHAALGGGDGTIQLGVFGSQALHTYPSNIEDVVPAFTDCTKTDTEYVGMDCGEDSGTSWQAACTGIGAHLHEVGHLFGCPHQASGVMLRDYVTFNRTFLVAEPYSTRTKQPGLRPCLPTHECAWHRLDTLRFRSHPSFRLAGDAPVHPEAGVQVWAVDQGRFMVTAKSGISFIELYPEGREFCETWIDYQDREVSPEGLPRQINLSESEVRNKLPSNQQKLKLKLEIHSHGQGKYVVEDLSQVFQKVKIGRGQVGFGAQFGFVGPKYGESRMDGSQPQEIILFSAIQQTRLLTSLKVYHGFALDGIEFVYEDGDTQLFGNRGGKSGGSEVILDVRKGETLSGFYIRAGLWVDGLAVITSLGRQTEFFGNANGGSGHSLMPPRGYSIAGISGTCGKWVDGLSLIITR